MIMENNINLKDDLFVNLNIIIKYQNSILLKIIADENNWNYEELKKKYLKNKIKKEEIMAVTSERSEKNDKNENKQNETNRNTELKDNYKLLKKIKIKRKRKKTHECYKFEYLNTYYFINPKNNNSYDVDGNFVGILENNEINFDMEEVEN